MWLTSRMWGVGERDGMLCVPMCIFMYIHTFVLAYACMYAGMNMLLLLLLFICLPPIFVTSLTLLLLLICYCYCCFGVDVGVAVVVLKCVEMSLNELQRGRNTLVNGVCNACCMYTHTYYVNTNVCKCVHMFTCLSICTHVIWFSSFFSPAFMFVCASLLMPLLLLLLLFLLLPGTWI